MAEYLERKTAVMRLMQDGCSAKNVQTIMALPAADVAPVVRCKDCQKSGVTEFGKRFCSEPMGAFYGCIPVEDDFFCSGGRRRDGA